jgi:hypothetical protein
MSKAGEAFQKLASTDPASKAGLERARAKLNALAAELRRPDVQAELRKLEDEWRAELVAQGFDPPTTLEDWEELARIVALPFETVRLGRYTLAEVDNWRRAWVKRERIRRALGAAEPEPDGWNNLSDRQRGALLLLHEKGAIDADTRQRADDVLRGLGGDRSSVKAALADLAQRGLTASRTGRGGGCWLTPAGRRLAGEHAS